MFQFCFLVAFLFFLAMYFCCLITHAPPQYSSLSDAGNGKIPNAPAQRSETETCSVVCGSLRSDSGV